MKERTVVLLGVVSGCALSLMVDRRALVVFFS